MNYTHRFLSPTELRRATRDAPLFTHPSWWAAVEEGLGYRCVGLLTEAPRLAVLTVGYSLRFGPFKLFGSPLRGCFAPYHDLLTVSSEDTGEVDPVRILASQHAFLRKFGFGYIEFGLSHESSMAPSLMSRIGAERIPDGTLVLQLPDQVETAWMNLEGRARNMVRKAQKAGVQVRKCELDTKAIGPFHAMLSENFARARLAVPHPIRLYEALISRLAQAGRLLFLEARHRGRTVAIGLFAHDREMVNYVSGASLPMARDVAATSLLQWEVICRGIQLGLRTYDLGGTGVPSVDRFKRSFGPAPHEYYRVIWTTTGMRRVLRVSRYLHPYRRAAWFHRIRGIGFGGRAP